LSHLVWGCNSFVCSTAIEAFRRELRFRLRLGLGLNFWLRSWCGRGQFLFVGSAPQRNSRYGCDQGEKEKYSSLRFPTFLPAGGLNAYCRAISAFYGVSGICRPLRPATDIVPCACAPRTSTSPAICPT